MPFFLQCTSVNAVGYLDPVRFLSSVFNAEHPAGPDPRISVGGFAVPQHVAHMSRYTDTYFTILDAARRRE